MMLLAAVALLDLAVYVFAYWIAEAPESLVDLGARAHLVVTLALVGIVAMASTTGAEAGMRSLVSGLLYMASLALGLTHLLRHIDAYSGYSTRLLSIEWDLMVSAIYFVLPLALVMGPFLAVIVPLVGRRGVVR